MCAEWSIGLTEDDDFLMRPIVVIRDEARQMEIKDGMFWYNGQMTQYSLREVGVRSVHTYSVTLERGLSSVYVFVYSC